MCLQIRIYPLLRTNAEPAFLKAAPYFEEALKLDPTEFSYMNSLRNIYYNAEDGANLERIEKMLGE